MKTKTATRSVKRTGAIPVKRKRKPGGKGRAAGSIASYSRGREDGTRQGMDDGHYYGRCNAVIEKIPKDTAPLVNMKLLFVTSGKGLPYSPLDEAVIEALAKVVTMRQVISPNVNAIVVAQQFRPDLVLVLEGMDFPLEHVKAIRGLGIPTAIWFTDDPYYTDHTPRIAVHYDYVFTQDAGCVEFYRTFGHRQVYHMPLAANPNIFRPLPVGLPYRRDVSFIGSAFWNRVHFIDRVAGVLAPKSLLISGNWWNRLRSYRRLASKINAKGWMGPLETARHYFGSRIVINIHRSPTDEAWNSNRRRIAALSVNPRMFEIAACGAFQLSDERQDMGSVYTPGHEIVTYRSPADFVEKLNHYLVHDGERKTIALRALRRTLTDHTYVKRLRAIVKTIFPGKFTPVADPNYINLEQLLPVVPDQEAESQVRVSAAGGGMRDAAISSMNERECKR